VAGSGFAGVETIAAVNDFLRQALPLYRNLHQKMLRLVLVHSGPNILSERFLSAPEDRPQAADPIRDVTDPARIPNYPIEAGWKRPCRNQAPQQNWQERKNT
jgi:hypothetical protein